MLGVHKIYQPRDKTMTVEGMTVKMKWSSAFARERAGQFDRRQAFIDSECVRRMAPDTPRLKGMLIKSAIQGTKIGSGEIHQDRRYARRQYYEHKEKSYWFERMKNRDKDQILEGAKRIV
ncbi:hypothetical protein IMSAGC018_01910 [Lachnospiraceae bacterium]|nr:hypothetical protein IMSAGC018_01910 [Lachnospiraceae bacterium]